MAKKSSKRKKTTRSRSHKKKNLGFAAVCLILNVFIFPGVGTLLGGKLKTGVWQIALFLVGTIGTIFVFFLVGAIGTIFVSWFFAAVMFVAWLWGLFSGLQFLQQ